MGTYEELVEKGGSFSEFIQTHVGEELDTGSTERNKQMLIQKTAYDTRWVVMTLANLIWFIFQKNICIIPSYLIDKCYNIVYMPTYASQNCSEFLYCVSSSIATLLTKRCERV